MKKQLLLIVMLLSAAASAFAVEVEIDGLWYEVVAKAKVAKVIKYKNNVWYNGDIVIPETVVYEGITCSVTSIGDNAFSGCSGLTSVIIPNSVTGIGSMAFYYCSGLTSVTIGNSVTSIGWSAFRNCSGLTSVTIGNSVTSIEDYAFSFCGLTSVTIPNSVTRIGVDAFAECSGLTSVTIGDSVTSIGDYAFYDCSGLTSVTIGNSVTSIGDWAFWNCSDLTSVTIPDSVTSIGGAAFMDCSGLTSVVIGGGVKTISSQAFASCLELADVTCYAENVPSTQSNAFENSYIEYGTLHVPTASIDTYKTTVPWSDFGEIVALPSSEHKLTYYVDGEVYKTYNLKEGTAITPEPLPIKEGYTFNGWSEIPETMPDHDVTVTGSFTINKYKLIYILDGKEYKTYEVEYGASITAEPAPTKEDYTFSGWSELPETMPAHDVTVTGTFTLTYPNGQCETPTISYSNGKLKFECKTEGVDYISTISDEDVKTHTTEEVSLTATYLITVYAKAEGYKNSEVATATLCWIDAEPFAEGTKEAEDNVTEVKSMPVLIQANAGVLNIFGAPEGANISVYDTSGRMLGSSTAINGKAKIAMSSRARTAIVKIGDKAVKVKIK